ncbi:hypothetical protein E4U42_006538, partial [Claviceps africana]
GGDAAGLGEGAGGQGDADAREERLRHDVAAGRRDLAERGHVRRGQARDEPAADGVV